LSRRRGGDNMIHLEECLMEAIADYKNESINKINPFTGLTKKEE
jgi:hypothetical protein